MTTPTYSAADFASALQALKPLGLVWPRDPDAAQAKAFASFAPTFSNSAGAGLALLVDAFPSTAVDLLPEWESTLGLPDPCAGPAPSTAARQAQVLARFVGVGGSSVPYLIAFAAALGYTITITQYTFHSVDSPVDYPIYSEAWAHTWTVNVATGDNAVLECELAAIAHAHTRLAFNFT